MRNNLRLQKKSVLQFIQLVLLVVFFSSLLTACSKKGNPEPKDPKTEEPGVKSNAKVLNSLLIKKADNPTLSEDAFVYKNNTTLYVTLPLGSDLTKVKLSFNVSPKATIAIDGKVLPDLSGTLDLSKTLKAVVTSESGSSQNYLILAQTGIKELDKLIYQFKEEYSIPGISFAISKTNKSEIVYKSGIGFAVEEELVRAQPNHLFRLASVSKQFTSISIMKLIQDGKLTVNSKVFGPDGILKDEFPSANAHAAKVTIRTLLDHSTGWGGGEDPMFDGGKFANQTLDQLIDYVLKMTPTGDPGTKFAYFNMGYGILGKVIEKISGKKFEVYMKEVLAEAGITDIHVGGSKKAIISGDSESRRANEAVYFSQGGYNGYNNNMQVIAAAGGVIASPEQMLKLLTYIDGRDNIPDILTPEIRNLMLTKSQGSTYALGWRLGHRLYPDSWFHGGNVAGTASFWVMGPDINCVILCNSRAYISNAKGTFDDNLYYLMADVITEAAKHFKD